MQNVRKRNAVVRWKRLTKLGYCDFKWWWGWNPGKFKNKNDFLFNLHLGCLQLGHQKAKRRWTKVSIEPIIIDNTKPKLEFGNSISEHESDTDQVINPFCLCADNNFKGKISTVAMLSVYGQNELSSNYLNISCRASTPAVTLSVLSVSVLLLLLKSPLPELCMK